MAVDWVKEIGDDQYSAYYGTLNPAQQQRAKRKYKKTGTPWYARADREDQGAGAVQGADPYASGQAQPLGGTGAENTTGTTPAAGETYATRGPGDFGKDIGGVDMWATPGSFAAGIHGTGKTPDALATYADNPYTLYGAMASDQYGVPAGGRATGLFAEYLNPQEKAVGILGDGYPRNNLEWVNFGEQLFGSLKANGQFLSPQAMIQNVIGALLDETQNMAKGGEGVSNDGAWNPLRGILSMSPSDGLEVLLSTLSGVLTGTMPDDDLRSYLSWVEMTAQEYLAGYGRGEGGGSFEEQAAGRNWITSLVQALGPTLGL